MTRRTLVNLGIVVLLLVAGFGMVSAAAYYVDLPSHLSQHETIVLGQTTYSPGSQAALRVLVRDSKDGSPLQGAQVSVSMRPKAGGAGVALFKGDTDSSGTTNVSFKVPADAASDQTLVIETSSKLGQDTVERTVRVERQARVLLTTDKPIFQPGQVIHLRALALNTFDLSPAGNQELEITIADGKGNKVFRQPLTTSVYGITSTDFQLASEVNSGAYKITARLGSATSEKTVTVEAYSLPKYQISLKTGRPFYLPGQHLSGVLKADYFFGKPVGGAKVVLEGFTFDVERKLETHLEGVTSPDGSFEFEFNLPSFFAGDELDKGAARFYLQATLTDLAQATETSNLSIPISGSALVIDAIPEGGQFKAGVENILYVLVSYPDGSPADANVVVNIPNNNARLVADTGAYGLAEVRYTPNDPYQHLRIEARDSQGNLTSRELDFQGEYSEETVLLRPEQPVYKVGDTMYLNILTSASSGTVYLDIVRSGQTVSTRSVQVQAGQAALAVDLTPDLYGTIELHAYKILQSGSISRDTRLVVVDQADSLKIGLAPGQQTYRPGDPGKLNIDVQGSDGKPAQAALGIAVVDESVFALAQQDPGFAKLYFMLEQELLQPKYDLHGYSLPDLVQGTLPPADPALRGAVSGAAQASLATSALNAAGFGLQANSRQENLAKAQQMQSNFFGGLANGLLGIMVVIPLAVFGLNGFALWKQKTLGHSLLIVAALLFLAVLAALFWPLGSNYTWVQTPLDRLGVIFQLLANNGSDWMGLLGLTVVGCCVILAIHAIQKKDAAIGWSLLLIVLFILSGVLLVTSLSRAQSAPPDSVLILALVALLLVPFVFLLRFAGFAWRGQTGLALVTLPVALFLLVGLLPLLQIVSYSTRDMGGFGGGPVMDFAAENKAIGLQVGALPLRAGGPAAPQAPAATAAPRPAGSTNGAAQPAAEPPRLRQYFPETMLWLPELITGADGKLSVDLPVADNITTWRVTALASTQDGRLGSASAPLKVFQDFFVDLTLPQALTVGDEVSIPVGVFNYLGQEQTVRLELAQSGWFELKDDPVKEIKIGANEVSVVTFRIKAVQFGSQPFKVTAIGSKLSDAIQKDVQVYPDGKQITFTRSDRLQPAQPVSQIVNIPADAIAGTQKLLVKIYPGMLSQVVEGMDSILRMPYGCFEQTSSTTYPNVLVLDYLKSTNQAAPEIQMKAEQYINLGYQRLTTFEVKSSGGFSLFGSEPADRMLTAYGLQEFSDMSRVHAVDPDLIKRAANWLLSQQEADGSWKNDRGLVHEDTWQKLGDDKLPVTAYIAWALADAGFGSEDGTKRGLDYVRENQSKAKDAYSLALVANALVAGDLKAGQSLSPAAEDALNRLAELAKRDGDKVYWSSEVATFMGATGDTGSVETTALAAFLLQRADRFPDLANGALTFLIKQKDSFGTWHSTQATVLALKALLQSLKVGAENVDATVTVSLNGSQARTVKVTRQNFDVVQLLSFDDVNPGADNKVDIKVEGVGSLMYQVSGSYYLPWEKLAAHSDVIPAQDAVSIQVAYDRTQLAVNEMVTVSVTVKLNQPGAQAEQVLIDLGLPPGFSLRAEDLSALVEKFKDVPKDYAFPILSRFEQTGRQILVYANNLSSEHPLTFTYRLQAKFPLSVHSPASSAYDYYNPGVSGEQSPQALVVNP